MSNRKIPGLYKQFREDGSYDWKIDKRVRKYGRICESTGTSDYDEAEAYLTRRLDQIRRAQQLGIRPKRQFREAATKYLNDHVRRRGISRDGTSLLNLDPYIGAMMLDEIHDGSLDKFRKEREAEGISIGTVDRDVGVAARVLEEAARKWRDARTNLTWLAEVPAIEYNRPYNKRQPYPLDWQEQRLLFGELAAHLEVMALFDVNTGLRDEELCALEWAWEQRVPELDTPTIRRTVFVLPEGGPAKYGKARVVVLNDIAQSIIEGQRGLHDRYVFTWADHRGVRDRLLTLRNSGWIAARRRATTRYKTEIGREAPKGFQRVRAHDLRHTFGRRLRAAGVSLEDRQDLLGHEARRITTHYSAVEIENLVSAANRITKSRESPTPTVLRVIAARA
jgi:integrase